MINALGTYLLLLTGALTGGASGAADCETPGVQQKDAACIAIAEEKEMKVYAVRCLSCICHPLIAGKRTSRDPDPEDCLKRPQPGFEPRYCSNFPYHTWLGCHG